MSYEEATAYLDALGVDAMKSLKPSLHRIEAICAALDHPESSIPAIHVTGTNGKTSTARIATSLLTSAGLNAATYTSPHLQTVRERLTRGGENISADDFGDLFAHILPFIQHVENELGEQLSYFEVLTAMFFLWAAEAPVDVMVVEVGLGGRWDATNVIMAPVSVITNVGLDHTGLLGAERSTIAREKAGIIKPRATVVTAALRADVLEVIGEEAEPLEAQVKAIERDFRLTDNRTAFGGRYLSVATTAREYEGMFLPLHGSHQGVNAATALEAVVDFLPDGSLDPVVVAEGMAAAQVPGRLESLHPEEEPGTPIVLDVAHNPDGMSALIGSLLEAFAFDRVMFVVGILGDKDYRGMLSELARLPCDIIATQAKSVRSVSPADLVAVAEEFELPCTAIDDVGDAVKAALTTARATDLVCITGSHYVVGEARTLLVGAPD
jgi:dihydrofolate synthase / folylpolyglutamate synthase